MDLSFSVLVIAMLFGNIARAASTFSPARPPSLPLAVKSPYLSTWLSAGSDGGNGGYLPGQWPVFWYGQTTGWTGMVRVDGTAYTWMGAPQGPATADQVAYEYTSTKSVFTIQVNNKVELNVTFLSPLTPDDFQRQSLVFSYLNVEVTSIDGANHDVQLYTDISAEWVSGDTNDVAEWDYGTTNNVAYHKVFKQTQLAFSETNNQGEWGNYYYATDATNSSTYQAGSDNATRGAFIQNGKLGNSKDTNYRAIGNNWPVFGFAVDLGSVSSSAKSTLFSIGLCQEYAVQFEGTESYSPRKSLWTSYFSDDLAALSFFHKDYSTSTQKSTDFDSKVAQDSIAAAGQNYLTITSLAARQVFGAVQLVGDSDKQYLFLKEISSNGNMQTVDVIFPAHPMFLYTNPTLLKLLLDPLFENQESGHYPNAWAMHDLGSHFPNATGHTDGLDEKMPLEECGNMLIMVLAYAQRSQDTNYLKQHYNILKQWTGYLVDEALIPAEQLSTDDFAGPLANQTNLALKGMIGIEGMAVIANLTGNTADAENYTSIAHNYINQWTTLGVNKNATPPHSTLNYGNGSTWGLLYNLYADRLLSTNLVPSDIYTQQSNYYPSVQHTYGVPLDNRHTYTKSDWEMFAAAVAEPSTRDMFISHLANWINKTPTNLPFTDLYDTDSGDFGGGNKFAARPVQGGTFALLALP